MNNDYPSTKPQLTAADFHGNAIRLIEKDGECWLTAHDLGVCLDYATNRAKDGILKIYERHRDEFTEKDSTTVKLTAVDGKERDTRIFSPSGCFLLSFFANTRREISLAPCLRRLFVHNMGRGVENLVNSGLPHPTLWFFYARTGNPVMPGGQRIQYPRGESSRLTVYSFRTPRHPYNRESSKNLNRSQS